MKGRSERDSQKQRFWRVYSGSLALSSAGLGLVSAASLLLVLTLTRLFAVQQFYHFAFMAVSMGLLGNAASGSLLSVWSRRPRPEWLAALFALGTFGAYLLINYLPFDSFAIAREPRQAIYLALYFLAPAAPFLFSGLLVATALEASPGSVHRAYAVNLIGSAFGSLAVIPAMGRLGGEGTLMLVVALGLGAAALYLLADRSPTTGHDPGHPKGRTRARVGRSQPAPTALGGPGETSDSFFRKGGLAVCVLGALVALLWAFYPPDFLRQRLSPYKALSTLLLTPDAHHTLTRWNAVSRVDVVESSAVHSLPGLGLTTSIRAPLQAGLLVDGDNLMPITALAPDSPEAAALADRLPVALAFALRPEASTLVIEPGAGFEALAALALGAREVTVIEDNRLILDLLRDQYAKFTGDLYLRPEVTLVNQAGRSFVRNAPERFDVVVLALTDPYRPVTSGAYSLTENYLLTTEAVADYLKALRPGGLLVISRWLQVPPSEEVKTFGMIHAALLASGREPIEQTVLAFRSMRTATFVVGERPLIPEETARVRRFLEERGLDPILLPGLRSEDLNRFNRLNEPLYYDAFQALLADPEGFYARSEFDVRPATDDRPFFYHFFRWAQTRETLATLGLTWQPFGGGGYFVLLALLALAILASVVLVLGPLLVRRPSLVTRHLSPVPRHRWRVLFYFSGLGLGYLLVEVSLSQKLILLLDQPVIALAAVLFSLLTFSGLGSLTAPRWPLPLALALLATLILVYPWTLSRLSEAALAWPSGARLLAACLSLAPLGLLMGVPFARGLAMLERLEKGYLPWAWAINGSASVISPVLAVLIALSAGFRWVMLLGAASYALALAAFGPLWRKEAIRE